MNEAPDTPCEVCEVYRSRRDALCDGLDRAGWSFPKPRGTMFAWAPFPSRSPMGSLAFAEHPRTRGEGRGVARLGFGPGGEGFVRFALVENEHRIRQAVRGIRRVLEAGPPRRAAPQAKPRPDSDHVPDDQERRAGEPARRLGDLAE